MPEEVIHRALMKFEQNIVGDNLLWENLFDS